MSTFKQINGISKNSSHLDEYVNAPRIVVYLTPEMQIP